MKFSRSQKHSLRFILLAGLLLITAAVLCAIFSPTRWIALLLYLPAFGLAGYSTLSAAVRNILSGSVFDENFLMSIAAICALMKSLPLNPCS